MKVSIRNHRIFIGGKAVAFRQTPNGGKAMPAPTGIIVHDTAGDLKGTGSVSWLCNPDAKASAHLVVGWDGTIWQLQALNKVCWHAGKSTFRGRTNCNSFTIGIEIANPGAMGRHPSGGYTNNPKDFKKGVRVPDHMDVRQAKSPNHGPAFWLMYSDAQLDAVTALCRAIAEAYAIDFIAPHWEICVPKGRKVDTNPLFPLAQLRADVFGKPQGIVSLPAPDDEFEPIPDPQDDASGAKPKTMAKSVEGAVHTTNGTIGTSMAANEVWDATNVVDKVIEAKGKADELGVDVSPVTVMDYVGPLFSKLYASPLFWIGLGMAVLGLIGWIRRRRRMRLENAEVAA